MPPCRLFASAFDKGQGNCRELGEFPTQDAALKAATEQVINDLFVLYNTEQSAKELFDLWVTLGDDVFIVPDDATAPFSATNFARLIVLQVTLDESRDFIWK